MLNLLLLSCGFLLYLFRITHFPKFVPGESIDCFSLDFLQEGLHLYNNITTFSLLSFFEHVLSSPLGSVFPSLSLVPVFSIFGVNFVSINRYASFCQILSFIFILVWIFEIKKEGYVAKSTALKASVRLFFFGIIIESLINRNRLASPMYVVLLCSVCLYFFRILSYRNHALPEKKQSKAWIGFSIVFLFLFLTETLTALLLFSVFAYLELQYNKKEETEVVVKFIKEIFMLNKLPALGILFYATVSLFFLKLILSNLIPLTIPQLIYFSYSAFLLRVIILYGKSFLELIRLSASYRKIVYIFLLPASLWLLYPNPNRFFTLFNSYATKTNESLSVRELYETEDVLMPLIADDRRFKLIGIQKHSVYCKAVRFSLTRRFPDWSRNPEADFCDEPGEKLDAKILMKEFEEGSLRTLVSLYPPRFGIPFEISMFLKESEAEFDRATFQIKSWNLAGSVVYLAEAD